MGIAIELKNIDISYDAKSVLQDISFRLDTGTFTGILGPNGAGKTTLLRAISGIRFPDRGEILLHEKPLNSLKPKERARLMSFVPQGLHLTLPFSVHTIVAMGRTPHLKTTASFSEKDHTAVQKAMEETDILAHANSSILALSAGEQQRALLAMALAQETSILLLDEPTAHLDLKHTHDFLALLRRLVQERSLTVLISLHDLNLAAQYCEKVLFLKNSEIDAFGNVPDVMTSKRLSEIYEYPLEVEQKNNRFFILPQMPNKPTKHTK